MRLSAALLAVLMLAGCGGLGLASGAMSVVSYATTGKAPAAHVLGAITDSDCEFGRAFAGDDICERRMREIVQRAPMRPLAEEPSGERDLVARIRGPRLAEEMRGDDVDDADADDGGDADDGRERRRRR